MSGLSFERSKRTLGICSAVLAACICTRYAGATVVVNDTWTDSTRTDPTAANGYSEYGTDSDADGSIESAWFINSPNVAITPGHMTATLPTGSQNWTTYFTPTATPISLLNPGDFVKVTWVFTPSGVSTSTSQAFNFALVDTPGSARVTGDAAPGTAAYAGYAMFTDMATTLGNGNSFQLRERTAASSTLLNASGDWAAVTNGATTGATGYANGTQYTMTWTMTRGTSNDLLVNVSMAGGSLNNTGSESVSFDDTTPNTFTYDTFNVRPSGSASSATTVDFNSFEVETNTALAAVPEPTCIGLLVLGGAGLMARRRRAE